MNIFPYTNFHDLNLDWIIKTLKQVLYKLENLPSGGGGGGAVDSVNGKTGTVVLTKSDIGLGSVDNVRQYSASNPPPYPVTSVNGSTGAVTVNDVVYVTTTSTSADIENAYQARKVVVLKVSGTPNKLFYLVDRVNATRHFFVHFDSNYLSNPPTENPKYSIYQCNNDVWTLGVNGRTLAPDYSPALTGIPTAPTAVVGTNTTQIATTAFVQAAIAAIPNANGEDF